MENSTSDILVSTEQLSSKPILPYDPREWFTWILVALGVCATLGVILNTLTIVAFLKSPMLTKGKPAHQLIFNLAIGDLVSCVISQPFFVFYYTEAGTRFVANQKVACLLSLSFTMISSDSSLVAVPLMSVERLLAIGFPFLHRRFVTRRNTKIVIVLSWIVVLMKDFGGLYWNSFDTGSRCLVVAVLSADYINYFYSNFVYGMVILVLVLNILLAYVAMRAYRNRPSHQASGSDVEGKAVGSLKKQTSNVEMKIVKMVLTIVGVLFISWVPFTASALIVLNYGRAVYPPRWVAIFHDSGRSVVGVTTFINPLVYMSQNKHYRQALMDLFHVKSASKAPQTSLP